MPSTISVLLTPRVSFCPVATPASASAPTTTAAAIRIFIARSFSFEGFLSLRVHGVDHVLVLRADERPLQLHGRRQLLVIGGEDLLDEAKLLDGLDTGQLPIHALDLAPDQVPHLRGAAERGE